MTAGDYSRMPGTPSPRGRVRVMCDECEYVNFLPQFPTERTYCRNPSRERHLLKFKSGSVEYVD
jgi:hypothetical protein